MKPIPPDDPRLHQGFRPEASSEQERIVLDQLQKILNAVYDERILDYCREITRCQKTQADIAAEERVHPGTVCKRLKNEWRPGVEQCVDRLASHEGLRRAIERMLAE